MKVEVTETKMDENNVKFTEGLYKDKDGDLWLINEDQDAICLNLFYKSNTFNDLMGDFGPLTYFTGTVTLTND